jgi:hypothetical protein
MAFSLWDEGVNAKRGVYVEVPIDASAVEAEVALRKHRQTLARI